MVVVVVIVMGNKCAGGVVVVMPSVFGGIILLRWDVRGGFLCGMEMYLSIGWTLRVGSLESICRERERESLE